MNGCKARLANLTSDCKRMIYLTIGECLMRKKNLGHDGAERPLYAPVDSIWRARSCSWRADIAVSCSRHELAVTFGETQLRAKDGHDTTHIPQYIQKGN